MSTFKFNSNQGTTASEVVSSKAREVKPKWITSEVCVIDHKALRAKAYNIAFEQAEQQDSFVAELDIDKDGLSIEHKAHVAEYQEILDRAIEMAESTLTSVMENAGKVHKNIIFASEWENPTKTTYIKTKYAFDPAKGIIALEYKDTPSKEVFTYGQPTTRGLAGFRAELSQNEALHDNFDELQELHNNSVLLTSGLAPEAHIYADLIEQDESDPRRSTYASQDGSVWLNYYDGFITSAKNERQTSSRVKTRREF